MTATISPGLITRFASHNAPLPDFGDQRKFPFFISMTPPSELLGFFSIYGVNSSEAKYLDTLLNAFVPFAKESMSIG